MAGRKRYSVVRDPVHGDVYLTHEELRLLDTPEMQRLRGVKQLGSAYLVFPGAVHTRFDHSIGSLFVTQRMIDSINRSFELDPAATLSVGEEEARVVRIAALLHDVTHVPFGHALEDQDGLLPRHDSAARFRRVLERPTGLGAALREIGVLDEVLAILCADPEDGRGGVPRYWRQIVAGTLSSDLLDYLARDAYFTGLRIQVDPRVTSYFKIDRQSGNLYIDLAKHELLREDILSEIVRLLEARYYFSERVYYHHAKVAAGALVARAVELAFEARLLSEAELQERTDESLLDLLGRRAREAPGAVGPRVAALVERFRARRLPKRAAVFPAYANRELQEELVARFFSAEGARERREVEARIADLVRFATGREIEVIVYCPARHMQLKEARTHVRWPGEPAIRPLSDHAERIPRLGDLERSYRELWKFYVLADASEPALLARVQEAALQEFAGATNVYDVTART
jgi:HD superfamily phosphohydrolase